MNMKTNIIVVLTALFLSTPTIANAIDGCELDVDTTGDDPCMVITDFSQFSETTGKNLKTNKCHDLGHIYAAISDGKNDKCRIASTFGSNMVLFQHGGKPGITNDGIPKATSDQDLYMFGSMNIKSQSSIDGNSISSGPVTITNKPGQFLHFLGNFAEWDSNMECLGTECAHPTNNSFSLWANQLLNDAQKCEVNGVLQECNWSPVTYLFNKDNNDVAISAEEPNQDSRMKINVEMDTNTEAAFTLKKGYTFFRDLVFYVKRGLAFNIGHESTAFFRRVTINIESSEENSTEPISAAVKVSPGVLAASTKPYNVSLGGVYGSPLDDTPLDIDRLAFQYSGEAPLKGYVKLDMNDMGVWPFNPQKTPGYILSMLIERYKMPILTDSKSHPIDFGTNNFECIQLSSTNDNSCAIDVTKIIEETKYVRQIWSDSKEHYDKTGAANQSGILNIGDRRFIIIDTSKPDSTFVLFVGIDYHNIDIIKKSSCSGDTITYNMNGTYLCTSCPTGQNLDADGVCSCPQNYKKTSDDTCTILCDGNKVPTDDGTTCECPSDKPYLFNDTCIDKTDDAQCSNGMVMKIGNSGSAYCTCPEGTNPNKDKTACIGSSICQLTQNDCGANTTFVKESCSCEFNADSDCPAGQKKDGDTCVEDAATSDQPDTCTKTAADCAEREALNETECLCETATEKTCAAGEELNADGECITMTTTSCGDDEEWDVLEGKCVSMEVIEEANDSDSDDENDNAKEDGGSGCSFKKKSDGTYGCSLVKASTSMSGFYLLALLLGYFMAARLRSRVS